MLKKIAALKRPKHRENVVPLSWIATVAFVHARERALKKNYMRWYFEMNVYLLRTFYARFNRKSAE